MAETDAAALLEAAARYERASQPWWCGYPGRKVTGECGHPDDGPCKDADAAARS